MPSQTTERVEIPAAVLAARYNPNATYERATLVQKHYPDIPVYPGTAALVPVYAEQRAAAAAAARPNPERPIPGA